MTILSAGEIHILKFIWAFVVLIIMNLGCPVHAAESTPTIIGPAQNAVESYTTQGADLRYSPTIDLTAGKTEILGINNGGQGFQWGEDGLELTSTNNFSIVWGRQMGGSRSRFEEKFCSGWTGASSRWAVQIEIQQSRGRSEWYV